MKKIPIILSAVLFTIVAVSLAINPHSALDPCNDGGMWVIGPDLSPDSLNMQLLYYTPNAGTTITCIDTLVPDSYWRTWRIAADCCSCSFLYLTDSYYHFWVSSDGGCSWDSKSIEFHSLLGQGSYSGMVYFSPASYTDNFGNSLTIRDHRGLYGTTRWFYKGWNADEMIVTTNLEYNIYLGTDFSDTFTYVNDIDFDEFFPDTERNHLWFFKGGDVFGGDSIFYTEDFCTTRTFIGMTPRYVEYPASASNTHHDYFKGNNLGEIYAVYIRYNFVESIPGARGGWIRVCYSNDYGETFSCVSHPPSAGGVEESGTIQTTEKFFDYNGIEVNSDKQLKIFNINGKLVSSGKNIKMFSKSTGLYIVTDGENSAKIVNIK